MFNFVTFELMIIQEDRRTDTTFPFRLHVILKRKRVIINSKIKPRSKILLTKLYLRDGNINCLKPTGHVMHHQFNIQQLYTLPTLYLCVLYLSEKKQRLVPLTA